ncbi:hypothetical protein IP92_03097 [Pseudoduganella flava]|uniref:Uncharacterized protein n=1 Tax=Pseudoduganella flava TaxID=871742 RepID=A0A562PQL4_9BURK|nr:hypothetical protein IP92_03097 [Pseudoduganella flava]
MFCKLQDEYKTNNCRDAHNLLTICNVYLIRIENATQRVFLYRKPSIHAGSRAFEAIFARTLALPLDDRNDL